MTNRKILILSPELPAPDSGGSMRALQHLYLLNRLGHKPYLLSFFNSGQEAALRRMQAPLNALTREAFVFPAPMPTSDGLIGTLTRNVRYLTPLPLVQGGRAGDGYEENRYPLARAFDAAGAGEHLRRLLDEKGIDLLIIMHAWLLHYLPLVRQGRPAVHVVLDLVDLDSDLYAQLLKSGGRVSEQLRRLVGWVTTRRLERHYFPMCDEFWAVAPTEADKIRRICSRQSIAILPYVIDVNRVPPCESDGLPGQMLFVGSLFFSPNENAVIRLLKTLYPRIRQAAPTAHLTIVGGGLRREVERLARRVPGVTLSGYAQSQLWPDLPHAIPRTPDGDTTTIRRFYQDAQVVVAPIREGCGVRVKILEALAMGRAVVATPKAAEGLDLVDGEHLVIAESDDNFVDATLDLLRRPERRRTLGRNGRALVESRYSWAAAERIMAEETSLGVAPAAGNGFQVT